jgi:CysZ protein
MSVLGSVGFAVMNVVHLRMLWLMLWPIVVALVLWIAAAFALWTKTAVWLAGMLGQWLQSATFFLHLDVGTAALVAAHLILALLFVPLVYLTVLIILGVFGMQAMVEHVARRSYPRLERRRGGSLAGSLWNAVLALVGLLVLAVVTAPLWLVPPLWPLIPVAIMGWVNQRLLRYDALAEHASREEMRRIFAERRGAMYLLGALLALIAYVPLVGFFAPVLFGLAFIHYLLGALAELRHSGGLSPSSEQIIG